MNFDRFVRLVGDLPWFDFATVLQLSGEKRETLRVRLYEWRKAGKLLPLRRGMYALADAYRRAPANPSLLSNELYAPSYLSTHWALSFYGLIPEQSTVCTAVTPRAPRRFENEFGLYRYFHLKQPFFFGYQTVQMEGEPVCLARPEKALLDLWHLQSGEWTVERMREMRFQHMEQVDAEQLCEDARRFNSPRLVRAVEAWNEVCGEAEEGAVIV